MESEAPPIRAFLSYAHADEEEFGIVDPLTSKLKAFVRAKSGRKLEIFIDRDSIGWGENWRESISTSVENATVLIPLMTANYLESSACREEFLSFHSKAEVLGVTDLLLPILVFRSQLFGEDTTDEVAQIVESLQYQCIEDALLAGPQSPEWLQQTRDLSDSLLGAVANAESALLSMASDARNEAELATNSGGELPEEESGLAELMEELGPSVDRMTQLVEGKLIPAIEAFGEVPEKVGPVRDGASPKQFKAWTLLLAREFRSPSDELEAGGRELFDATKSLDGTLLKLKQLSVGLDDSALHSELTRGRRDLVNGFGDLTEVADNMESLLVGMQPAEILSVSLRQSLLPARRGLTAVRDAVNLIESWKDEFPDDEDSAG